MRKLTYLSYLLIGFLFTPLNHANDVPEYQADLLATYSTFDAKQGVAVDAKHFYATHNFRITKHAKQTGKPILQWDGGSEGDTLIHLDSLMELNGKLYASHSNYGHWPMTSSVEVWNAETMKHTGTYSFGVNRGSFTWLDRFQNSWWGAFANYDKVQKSDDKPYGKTLNTQVVQMDDNFQIIQSWILPDYILGRIRPMSNSGGSWGPDGYLYLTGHDHSELYVMTIPQAGSVLHHAATVKVPVMEGQGIAWDRSTDKRVLWGILKRERKVVKLKIPAIETINPQGGGTIRSYNFSKQ